MANKGFIKDIAGKQLLPITRAELVLDQQGQVALTSELFLAGTKYDKSGNPLPGLVTARERSLLLGNNGTGGISDLATKLDYINKGVYVDNTQLQFYNNNGATPLIFRGTPTIVLSADTSNNNIGWNLATVYDIAPQPYSTFIKGMSVDKYGRVISVTAGGILNEELPPTIQSKVFSQCTISEDGSSDKSLVSKKYIDDKFDSLYSAATGGLSFGGTLSDAATATAKLTKAHLNKYYKVTDSFTITKTQLYEQSDYDVEVKSGDTLIVSEKSTKYLFVYIPSGDEISSITIKGSKSGDTTSYFGGGNVILEFSDVFNVNKNSNVATVTLPPASATSGGYLTQEDYNRFQMSSAKTITYTGTTKQNDLGAYEIGYLSLDNSKQYLYGINTVASVTLNNGYTSGSNQNYDPILKFTGVAQPIDVKFKGDGSTTVYKDGNNVIITTPVNVIDPSSKYGSGANHPYLSVNGNKFDVKIGYIDEGATGGYVNGLTSYSDFITLSQITKMSLFFYVVENSLTDDSKDIHYGSQSLIDAIYID